MQCGFQHPQEVLSISQQKCLLEHPKTAFLLSFSILQGCQTLYFLPFTTFYCVFLRLFKNKSLYTSMSGISKTQQKNALNVCLSYELMPHLKHFSHNNVRGGKVNFTYSYDYWNGMVVVSGLLSFPWLHGHVFHYSC